MQALTRTARTTGLFYLGVAITGLLGFIVIRPQLFAADNPEATLSNLIEHATLARAGVAFELGMVVTQTLTAAWFFRLFRAANPFAASGIAAFGLVNAIVGLVSAAMLGTALELSAAEPFGDPAANVQLMYLVSDNLWGVGALFFGLWLVPMGWCVLRSGWMPRVLGWILIAGGAGYMLSAFLRYLVPDADLVVEALAYPASVGEFWIVGYLLIHGIRRGAKPEAPTPEPARPEAVTSA